MLRSSLSSASIPRALRAVPAHRSRPIVLGIALAAAALLNCGCKSGGSGPYQPQTEAARSPLEAERLTLKAVDLMDRSPPKLDEAEKMLRQALTADLYHGPAHNNLGVLFLKKGEFYSAATEFEWAQRLLPGSPDPRVNLALTLERAGRSTDALREYATALDIVPEHLAAIQGLTSLQLRTSHTDELTRKRLEIIAMRSDSTQWREWARVQMMLLER
jgi:tetratricopeptide (TPR) repeat protein